MKVFKVSVGVYDDKTWFIVRGAEDAEDALNQVREYIDKTYTSGWWSGDETSVEEIKLKKGVTQL